MPAKKYPSNIPVGGLTSFGGTRTLQRRLERSNTLIQNREAVSYALLCMANTKLTEIMTWDEDGQVKVKASRDIPEHALQAIKKIQVRVDKDGNNTLEIELYDKVGVLRLLAKASGLLDNPDENDKPSVIDVNVVAPNAE